jgi:hypothetical protein
VHMIKRWVVNSLVLLLCAGFAFPQERGERAREENLYSKALFASITEMEKSWGRIDDSNGRGGIRTDYRHMLVERDPEITDHLPSQLGDYRVEYLDSQAQIDRFKKLRKEFSILRIHPLQSEGSRLTVQVTVSYLKYEKGKLNLGLSDWSDVEFRFDCERQNYLVSAVNLGGI